MPITANEHYSGWPNTVTDVYICALTGSPTEVAAGTAYAVMLRADTNGYLYSNIGAIVPGTGATNLGKAVGNAAGATDTGVASLVRRDDALTALSDPDGDYVPMRVDANGALWASISASLPAGTNAIGKLAANSGVDIGDVDVTSVNFAAAAAAAVPAGIAYVGLNNGGNLIGWVGDASGFGHIVLEAGTASIGKLAANSGVDIGDVDVTSVNFAAAAAAAVPAGIAYIGGNNGGNLIGIVADASGYMQVGVATALPAGTNAIGKLAANSGVDIGDVDVTSVNFAAAAAAAVPAGIAYIGGNNGGNLIGIVADASGYMQVGVATALPAGTNAIGKLAANSGVDIGDVDVTSVNFAAAAAAAVPAGIAYIGGNNGGNLIGIVADASGYMQVGVATALPAGTNAIGKLAANSGVDIGDVDVTSVNFAAAAAAAVPAGIAYIGGNNGGNLIGIVADASGYMQVGVATALPAGTNAIGKLAANSGVDIGDVDVLSLPGVAAIAAAVPGSAVYMGLNNGGNLIGWVGDASGFGHIVLETSANAIGKLAANSGVDIGDVDVTSIVPGVTATSLGKAIDSAVGATDTGVASLVQRDDALTALTPVDGDYVPLRANKYGALWTRPSELVVDLKSSTTETASGNGAAVTGMGSYNYAFLICDVTAAGTLVGDTLDVYVDTSHDGGTTWTNTGAFTQVLGNGGVKRFYARMSTNTTADEGDATADQAAGTFVSNMGDAYRVRWAIADGGGSHSFTFAVYGVFR